MLYGVSTKRLNEQVKRNLNRFPSDLMFRLTRKEAERWLCSRSQNATLKRGSNLKYLPYAFAEHGALMVANILSSPKAIYMSVFVIRAFVRMRSLLTDHHRLAQQLKLLENKLTKRLDAHEIVIVDVLRKIMQLLNPPPVEEKPRKRMGFVTD